MMTIDNTGGVEQTESSTASTSDRGAGSDQHGPAEERRPAEAQPRDEQLLERRYRVLELLGQGGFAAVYRAWDLHLDRACAIKENQLPSAQSQRQFEREANLLAGLHHPNLPRVTDHFIVSGRGQYLVMDYVEGEDLHQRLQRQAGPFEEAQALEWILPVCEALIYLHTQTPPVIHRDVKPQNIILTAGGQIYLVDFGIAKVFTPNLSTTIGARAVSPGYSPPEQYGQSTTDARSDLYSLAATLYTLLSGEVPPDAIDMMSGITPPPRPLLEINPRLSPHVAQAVSRAMQPTRTQRFANVAEFKQALLARPPQTELVYPLTEKKPASLPRASQPHDSARPKPAAAPPKPASRPPMGTTRPTLPAAWRNQRVPWAVPLVALISLTGLIGISMIAWLIFGTQPNPGASPQALPQQGSLSQTPVVAPAITAQLVRGVESTPQPVISEPTSAPATATSGLIASGEDSVEMALIPAGAFKMGLTDEQADWHVSLCNRYGPCDIIDYQDAMPAHTVYLDAFRLDVHEVTNRQYQACVSAGACQAIDPTVFSAPVPVDYATGSQYAEYPVVGVRWDDAQAYCQWVGKSLPTEAQWERAAAGDGTWLFPWGNPKSSDPLSVNLIFGKSSLANFCDSQCTYSWRDPEVEDGWEGPAPVMSYKPNFMGFFDLSGNVQEWVLDYYSQDYYTRSPKDNPSNLTPAACPGYSENDCHLTRGGGWNNGLYHSTARFRHFAFAGSVKPYRGFRCAAASSDE